MKQVLAAGRWSKSDQQWKTVVALHRPGSNTKASSLRRGEPRDASHRNEDR